MDYERFMKKAIGLAKEAFLAGEFPVGCVIVSGDQVIAEGRRRNSRGGLANETDHAEMNALRRLSETGPHENYEDFTLFTSLEPCLMCFGAIILSGVGKIVYAYEDVMGGGVGCALNSLTPLYKNSGIRVEGGVLRMESLDLFKKYFSDSGNDYWANSLLATHALSQ